MNHNIDLHSENYLKLKYGFKFTDLFESSKLKELTEQFYKFYEKQSPIDYTEFTQYRDANGAGFDETVTSKIIINSARFLEKFLSEFFGIENEIDGLKSEVDYERVILNVKKDFFQKRIFKKLKTAGTIEQSYDELNKKVNVIKSVLFDKLELESR